MDRASSKLRYSIVYTKTTGLLASFLSPAQARNLSHASQYYILNVTPLGFRSRTTAFVVYTMHLEAVTHDTVTILAITPTHS